MSNKSLLSILGFIIGLIMGFYLHKAYFAGENQGLLMWSYYFFQILGGIGTCLAVVVALFKDSIKQFIWHPKLEFMLVDEGIIEVINHNVANPTADMYKGIIRVTNKGNDSAKRCELTIEKIEYAQQDSDIYDVVHDVEGKRKIDWGSDNITIPRGKYHDIDAYEIVKATRLPQQAGDDQQREVQEQYFLNMSGPKIEDNYRKGGKLRISYCLNYNDGRFRNFILQITGDGLWRGRKEELRRNINIKLEEK